MAAYVDYNPTMATASLTMASHSPSNGTNQISTSVMSATIDHHVESREDLIQRLKSNLVQYARTNDRRMVVRKMKEATFLSYIPLEGPFIQRNLSLSQLESEVYMERVLLNGTLLKPPNNDRRLKISATNSGFLWILKPYVKALCEHTKLNENALYERILFSLSRTSALAEIRSLLSPIMESSELILRTLPSDYTVKSNSYGMIKDKTANGGDAPDLKLYKTEPDQIHMTLDTAYNLGLFRKNDMIANRPWIVMNCKIHERLNLSTNECFRSLSVKTPNLY